MDNIDNIIEIKGVTRHYEQGRIKALDGVDLSIRRGDYVSIIGRSGSGKSTLLHLIAAMDRPTSGEIVIDDINLKSLRRLDEIRSHKIGFIFQLHNLLPHLSAKENVMIPMYGLSGSATSKNRKAMDLLDQIGIAHLAGKRPTEMSGGERQRVAIARALANDPPIILGDEPTGDVDSKTGQQIMDTLESLHHSRNMTLIIVTHAADIAREAHHTIEIRDGKIISDKKNI